MSKFLCIFAICALAGASHAAVLGVSGLNRSGQVTWTNAFPSGVCTVERAAELGNKVPTAWQAGPSFFTTNATGSGSVTLPGAEGFFRLLAVNVSTNTAQGYTNLLESYGVIETVAGNGAGGTDVTNYWQARFEGGYATNAALSRPHFAMADNNTNIFIVDKDSHSVLKVTPDGRIHTVAGTHVEGDGPDGPTAATNVALRFPNGLWVGGDGTVYVLDTGNGKLRRLATNGMMSTLFTVTNGIGGGRGLWVKSDDSLAYYCDGQDLIKWTAANGVKTLNNNFTDLGNIVVDGTGNVIATDRGDNKVYSVDTSGGNAGSRTKLFGSGGTNAVIEGTLAKTNSLYGVRGVWLFPTGGYLLALHEGSQVLYVDAAGVVHVFVSGTAGNIHAGDGGWFHSPGYKICEVRAVCMDPQGNILITENDNGYVRRIRFSRLAP